MSPDGEAPAVVVSIIVVAAGAGVRLDAGVPKAFAPLGSTTVLQTALDGVRRTTLRAQCVVVVPNDHIDEAQDIARTVFGAECDELVVVVGGGATRADSVSAGLRALAPGVKAVLVHDAARALTPPELFDRVAELVLASEGGVVPARTVVDTIKRVAPDGEILATLDRSELALAQTPQGFPREQIVGAYARAATYAEEYTDDAAIVVAAGHRVVMIPGHDHAVKITVPDDLRRALAILAGSEHHSEQAAVGEELRTGIGVDAHRFMTGIPLWLGGIEWAGEPAGLTGHSDGDVACHAIVDALLSAAGLGDIGTVFGVDDPQRAGTAGGTFLRETVELLLRERWQIRSVAVEIIANRPQIGPRRGDLERTLSRIVLAPVSVAGTTSDGLGLTGGGEGIAAVATALISR